MFEYKTYAKLKLLNKSLELNSVPLGTEYIFCHVMKEIFPDMSPFHEKEGKEVNNSNLIQKKNCKNCTAIVSVFSPFEKKDIALQILVEKDLRSALICKKMLLLLILLLQIATLFGASLVEK